MSEFEIEKGVPIPRGGSGRPRKYPRDLDVGDSFFVPAQDAQDANGIRNSIGGTFRRSASGIRITTRVLTEGGQLGVRVWRVE